MPRGDHRLRRSMCLPTRWKDLRSSRNHFEFICEPRPPRPTARETWAAWNPAPGPPPPKANATLWILTPRRTSLDLASGPAAALYALLGDRQHTAARSTKGSPALAGKPLRNTLKRFPPSGSPQDCQHAGKRVAGGVSTRIRYRTQHDATQQTQLMTLNGIGTRGT
jgi:hypothetical protein